MISKGVRVWALRNELQGLKVKLYRLDGLEKIIDDIENKSGLFSIIGRMRLPQLRTERDFLRQNKMQYKDRIFEIEEWFRSET